MIKDQYLKSKEFYDSISVAIKLSILFIIGIGNYRTILFLIIFFCIKAFVDYKEKHQLLKVIFLPLFIVVIFLDFNNGQLWLVHNYNNLVLLIIAFIVVDHVFTTYINTLVEQISNGYVFSYCSKCKYENIKCTTKCGSCGYEKSSIEPIKSINISSAYDDQFHSQMQLLRYELNANTIANLSLDESERICMSLKVKSGNGPYIDGIKTLCSYIVVTNKNLILLHTLRFQRGWRWRDKIELKSIKEINAVNKKISVSVRQAISICTDNHTYEIFLWSIIKNNELFIKHFNNIKRQMSVRE